MRFSLAVLILGFAGCLAFESLTEEQQRHMEETHPSFEEIKKELEGYGTLKHPDVLGIVRRGETLDLESNDVKRAYRLFGGVRPVCREVTIGPLRIAIGNVADVLVRDFQCANKGCFYCHGKYIGVCEKTYTHFTLRILNYGKFNGKLAWHWIYRSYRIPACCKCVKK